MAKPNNIAIKNAAHVLRLVYQNGMLPSRVLECADDGITVCFVKDGNYAEIVCFNTGEIVSLISDRIHEPQIACHTIENVIEAVMEIKDDFSGPDIQT